MAWDTERTRRKLLETATELFAARGLDGTTVESIARAAGVNKERLYSYYGDKRALWDLVLATQLERLAASVELAGQDLGDIGAFAGATFDYHHAHPELSRLLQWEGLQGGVPADEQARTRHYREKVERLAGAQRDGAVDDSLDAAHLVFALIALASWWQTVPQLATMLTGHRPEDATEQADRRAFVVAAARRLAAPDPANRG